MATGSPTISTAVVTGMTCAHCVAAVRTELIAIEGVRDVDVDLETGRVTITSDADVAADDVRAAVDEAGYELVDFEPSAS